MLVRNSQYPSRKAAEVKPLFRLITPCFNARKLVLETIDSVRNQTALRDETATLEYILCDGGSTDGTVDAVEELKLPWIRIISEPDKGMYDALRKGFQNCTADYCAYLNAGDLWCPWTLQTLCDVFHQKPEVKWVTGINSAFNDFGQMVSVDAPYQYRRNLIQAGTYGRFLPYIQQESTFWRTELLAFINWQTLADLRLAGDYYLWACFSSQTDLYVLHAVLAGFRIHSGQLSEQQEKYHAELRSVTRPQRFLEWPIAIVDRIFWECPLILKRRFNAGHVLHFNHAAGLWM